MPRRNNRKGKRNKIKIGSTALGFRGGHLEDGRGLWGFGYFLALAWKNLRPSRKLSLGLALSLVLKPKAMTFWPEARARKSLGGAEVDSEGAQGGRGGEGCEEGCMGVRWAKVRIGGREAAMPASLCAKLGSKLQPSQPAVFPQAGNSCVLARLSRGKMHSMIVRKQEVDAVLWCFFHSLRRGIVLGATYHPALAKHVSVTVAALRHTDSEECSIISGQMRRRFRLHSRQHTEVENHGSESESDAGTRRGVSNSIVFFVFRALLGTYRCTTYHPVPVRKIMPPCGLGNTLAHRVTSLGGGTGNAISTQLFTEMLRPECTNIQTPICSKLRSTYSGNGPSLQREWFALS
ncbi:hypothetical protein DFH09DRAFT_1079223 [Mycena vulgaris]|nr:hypothetical protein DFH09DRAFT_1079223 [Mycena vulgaris]